MAMSPTQDRRIASLKTALGDNTLVLTRFDAEEAMSELFEITLEALSPEENIDFDAAIGRNASITVQAPETVTRHFCGVLVAADWVGTRQDMHAYKIVLRPWLSLLRHATNCRIFAGKSAPDIVKEVFETHGFSDVRDALSDSYPAFEYCVQYRETDLDFVCRLMEEAGIYYYFEHSADAHVLVLADAKSSHKTIPGMTGLVYLPTESNVRRFRDHVTTWTARRAFQTGRVRYKDYDYQKPGAKLQAESAGSSGYEHGDLELYDYPGRYIDQGEGDRLAKVRLQVEQAKDHRRRASGNAVALFPGGLITLERHPTPAENAEYLVLRCRHSYAAEAYRSGNEADPPYTGVYELLPADPDRPFRAPIVTPKAVVGGPQTAKVVGKDGEEIDVDEQGRITVQFHWDKEHVSRRVRIGQVWAGKSWGGIFIPRIGMEVIVQFLEGDPDQPLVVGTVYNGDNKVPYDLPGEKTKAGWKTESTKGGGGYNEIVFEDKKGSEDIGIHAEKDHTIVVENDETRTINNNLVTEVKHKETRKVSSDMQMGGRETEIVSGDEKLTVKLGNRDVKVELGTDSLEALLSITLKVMQSSITITPVGIVLDAPMITIKGMAMVTTTAPMVTTSADGIYAVSCSGALAVNTTVGAITGKSGLLPPLPPTSIITIA